jgi:hypothetical protein
MSGFEWFLVIVVVILIPLVIAVLVTLWTLEQARKRNPRNRAGGKTSGTKRQATRPGRPAATGDERRIESAPPERS